MNVHHAVRVGLRGMNGAMEREAGRVDRPVAGADEPAFEVDLDQVRRGDFAVVQAEGVDEKVRLGPGHAQRNVVVDELAPAQVRKDAVSGGELHARVPFVFTEPRGADESRRHIGPQTKRKATTPSAP